MALGDERGENWKFLLNCAPGKVAETSADHQAVTLVHAPGNELNTPKADGLAVALRGVKDFPPRRKRSSRLYPRRMAGLGSQPQFRRCSGPGFG
jgi:hypothetical protein